MSVLLVVVDAGQLAAGADSRRRSIDPTPAVAGPG